MSARALEPQTGDDFPKGLYVSLGAHALLFLYFILKMTVFSTDAPIPSAIRVDMVALPEKNQTLPAPPQAETQKATPETAPPEPAKAEQPKATLPPKTAKVKEPEAVNLKPKVSEKSAFEKLKAMQALEKIKNDVSAEKSAAAKSKTTKVKGNILAAGTELTGIDRLEHEDYRNTLDHHIKPHWQLPEWLSHKGLHARALVKVDDQGRLIQRRLIRSSGSQDFDASVLATIDQSAPFPVPPEKFVEMVSEDGILVDFGDEGGSR